MGVFRIPDAELNRQNMVVTMLTQALLGAITPNFRMVAINLKQEPWALRFVLERDEAEDREEINDLLGDFESFTHDIGHPAFQEEVMIEDGSIASLSYPWLVVFRRKERT